MHSKVLDVSDCALCKTGTVITELPGRVRVIGGDKDGHRDSKKVGDCDSIVTAVEWVTQGGSFGVCGVDLEI